MTNFSSVNRTISVWLVSFLFVGCGDDRPATSVSRTSGEASTGSEATGPADDETGPSSLTAAGTSEGTTGETSGMTALDTGTSTGDESDGGSTGETETWEPSSAAEAACRMQVEFYCTFHEACCTSSALVWTVDVVCQDPDAFMVACVASSPLQAGALLEVDEWPACRDALRDAANASACTSPNDSELFKLFDATVDAHCSDVVQGRMGVGEPCSVEQQCTEGLACTGVATPNEPSMCYAKVGLGEPCTGMSADPCLPGLVCIGGSCSPPSGIGGPCDGNPAQCVADLYCDHASGSCAPLLPVGEPCPGSSFTDPCLGHCDPNTDSCVSWCGSA